MVIKGTDKIKGVVDLASIGKQLSKTSTFSISDNDFWNSDVQAALRMGLIVSAGSPEKTNNPIKVVKCINTYHSTINLGNIGEIGVGHTFTMPESELNAPHIKAAERRGMIKVIQVIDPSDKSEGFLKIGDLFKEQEKKKAADKKAEAENFKKKHLETNESLPPITKVINERDPEPVEAETTEKIVWNPNSNPVPSTPKKDKKKNNLENAVRTSGNAEQPPMTETEVINGEEVEVEKPEMYKNVIDTDKPKPVSASDDDPRRNTVVVNPNEAKVSNTIKDATVWDGKKSTKPSKAEKKASNNDDISFVDEEAEESRVKNHPKLGKQKYEKKENDPIAPDSVDENRIAKHPVLKNKENQNTELDFIG